MKKRLALTFIVIVIVLSVLIPQTIYSQSFKSRKTESPIEKSLKSTLISELYFTNIAIEYVGRGYELGAYTNSDTNTYIKVMNKLLDEIDKQFYLNIEDILNSLKSSLVALNQYVKTGTFSDKNNFIDELKQSLKKIKNLEDTLEIDIDYLNNKSYKSYIEKTLNKTISGALYTAFMSIGALSDCFATGDSKDKEIKQEILNKLFDLLVYIGDITDNLKELIYTYDYSKKSKDFTEKTVIAFSMLKEMSNALKKYVENDNSKNAEVFEQIRQETRYIINLFLGDSKININLYKMMSLILEKKRYSSPKSI